MKKNNFDSFKVGTIFNPLKGYYDPNRQPALKKISILFPSRLNAMAIDPSKIAKNNNLIYTAGEVIFTVGVYLKVTTSLEDTPGLNIIGNPDRKSLIKHSFLLMKKTLGFKKGLSIEVENKEELKHIGLGSSGRLIAAVASSINEIYGNPIPKKDLVRFLAQNHGEETQNPSLISPVQCMGGSASAGLIPGGFKLILGDSQIVKTMNISDDYKVIIGIPKDYTPLTAEELLVLESKNFKGFIECGERYGPTIAYKILHEVLPSINKGELAVLGNLIYEYRFEMGSIKNCSFYYKNMIPLSEKIKRLKDKSETPIVSLSSVGPGFFAITKNPKKCFSFFGRIGMKSYTVSIENNGYKITEKEILKKQDE